MNVPPYGETFKKAMMHFANLKAKAQDTPNMTVKVSSGGLWYYTSTGASYVEFAGGNCDSITAPGSPNNKWVIIALTSTGGLVNIESSAAAIPALPTLPRGRFPLAAIYVTHADTTITEDMIFDIRPEFEFSVRDHQDLLSTAITGAHTGASISFDKLSSGLTSDNVQDAIIELKTFFDNNYSTSGTSGSGTSGTSGSGTSGTSGSGTSGTSGLSGSSGTSGSGTSGSSGTSGIDGTSGTSA
jgi:hypothetical protein